MSPPNFWQRLKLTVQASWFHFCLSRYLNSLLAIVNLVVGMVYQPWKCLSVSFLTRAVYTPWAFVELQLCHDSLFLLSEAMIHGTCALHSGLDRYMLVFLVVSGTAKWGTELFLLVNYAPCLAWTAKQWENSIYVSVADISPEKMAAGFPRLYMSMILHV
ncbi:hypothetical protein KC340_g5626 [Hortaea werneckii]|nr:hypothetical protein KC342_g12790 [Hortaea werneckii]KAI7099903.1 hypothetical protein KC339_g7876 [Hortaea werneckii]KAI7221821.1 hypothetical protein KC365_g11590 [Hortaea werneckii]KAI7327319.1 hypothetical protein KC340_g5626 [Hortaea werneckii]KAI7390204.1 hypothetical protein KC328_g8067 [Hortaea werneckii]